MIPAELNPASSQRAVAPPPQSEHLRRVHDVGADLTRALRALLESLPGPASSQARLSEATGLNRNSASKVTIAIGKRDALASIYAMPGPEALKKLLVGAKRWPLPTVVVSDMAAAIDRYERLVTLEFRGKPALDAAIASWLPEARMRVEAANRHLAYRGMSALLGVSARAVFTLGIIAPNPTRTGRCDALLAYGSIDLRRLVPGARLRLISITHDTPPVRYETVDGRPITHRPLDCLVPAFSTTPLPPMREVQHDAKTVWAVPDGDVAFDRPLDLAFAEVGIDNTPVSPPPDRRVGIWRVVTEPAQHVVVDLFTHRDVWPGREPACAVHETAEHGAVDINDRSRDVDQLPIAARVTELGRGTADAAFPPIERYRDLLQHLFRARGWDPGQFRGHRLSSTYPVYGAQYSLFFTAQA